MNVAGNVGGCFQNEESLGFPHPEFVKFDHLEVLGTPGYTPLQSFKAIDVADKQGLHGIRMVLESCRGSNGKLEWKGFFRLLGGGFKHVLFLDLTWGDDPI